MYKLVLLRGEKKKKILYLNFICTKLGRQTSIWIRQISVHGFAVKKKKEFMINKELETTTINQGCTSSWKYFQHMVCENLNAE